MERSISSLECDITLPPLISEWSSLIPLCRTFLRLPLSLQCVKNAVIELLFAVVDVYFVFNKLSLLRD